MILKTDGHPTRRRYSVGVVGSVCFHIALVAVVLWQASTMRPVDPLAQGGGSGRYVPRHSSALLRGGAGGGDPTGMAGPKQQPVEATPWPVEQAERLKLKLAIGWVIDHLWQSTLFGIIVGLLTLAFRRNRARVRYALWFGVSVKFLVPFSVVMWLGSIIGSGAAALFGTSDPTGAVAGSPAPAGAWRAITGAAGASFSFVEDLLRHPLIGGIGQWLMETRTVVLWPSTFTVTEVAAAWFSLALLGIWTFGFFAIVAARVRRSRQLWDVVLASRRVELLDVKVPARLQVGLSEGLLEPGVIGWFQPVLLLPADIEHHLTRPEIEAIVSHELCHVRRFDNMTASIHMLAEAIFWFHPLVWWLGGRLVDERERACDEHVLRSGGAPGPYAQGILNVCKRYVETPLASVSGVGSANVRQRIDAILANRIGEAISPLKKVMLSGIVFSVVIVPLAAGALQSPASPEAPRPRGIAASVHVRIPVTTYSLVVARAGQLGPGLIRTGTGSPIAIATAVATAAAADADGTEPGQPVVRPREIAANAMTVTRLAAVLESVVGGRVEDRTGLAGHYIVRLTWTSDPSGPSVFDAVQQQLGLQLVLSSSDAP